MRTSTTTTPVAIAGIAALGLTIAPAAAADPTAPMAAYPATGSFGTMQELVDASGAVVTGWTVGPLEPSDNVLPGYQPVGTLYEADATVTAVQGSVTPIISDFNARAADGQNYRVLFGIATADGVNPSTIQQGESTEGELFFDVTGAVPDSVVYNAGGRDLLIWTGGAVSEEIVDEVIIEETPDEVVVEEDEAIMEEVTPAQ